MMTNFHQRKPSRTSAVAGFSRFPAIHSGKVSRSLDTVTRRGVMPGSIDQELRHVMVTASQSRLEVRNFRQAFSKLDNSDCEKAISAARDLIKNAYMLESDVHTSEQIHRLLESRRNDPVFRKKPEMEALEAVCNRDFFFENLMSNTYARFHECFEEHMKKYLISFKSEPGADLLKPVMDYEERIQDYDFEIMEKLESMELLQGEYEDLKSPFLFSAGQSYLKQNDRVSALMERTCNVILETCDIIKRWASDDKALPTKLWNEIIQGNVDKGRLALELNKLKRRRDDVTAQVKGKQIVKDRLLEKIDTIKTERKKYKLEWESAEDRLRLIEVEYTSKSAECQEISENIENRKSNYPGLLDAMWKRKEALEGEMNDLTKQRNLLRKQMDYFESTIRDFTNGLNNLNNDLEPVDAMLMNLCDRLHTLDAEVDSKKSEHDTCAVRLAAAKRTRDMKLSSVALRKIFLRDADPEVVAKYKRFGPGRLQKTKSR